MPTSSKDTVAIPSSSTVATPSNTEGTPSSTSLMAITSSSSPEAIRPSLSMVAIRVPGERHDYSFYGTVCTRNF